MMERLEKMYDIISKMDFFNQRAARELWSHKPEKIQNQDIFNRHQDLCEIKEFVDDVAELMELEEQGLLLKLPCKVGDECYVSNATFKRVFEVYCISISKDKENIWVRCGNGLMYIWNEEIFATKAEAEKALAKLSEVD